MSNNYRLYLLGMTAAITFIGYWALVTFTLTLRFCFGPSEIWLNANWFNSPFHIYTSLVYFLFLWALLELLLLIINKTILGVRTVYITGILIFLAAFFFGHYRLDQTSQATRGERLMIYDKHQELIERAKEAYSAKVRLWYGELESSDIRE